MRIKNVSSTTIELSEFNLQLKPGDVADLSQFDLKSIHTNQRLSALFEKGLLINLGQNLTRNTKQSLQNAKQRIDKLNLGNYLVKEAKPTSNNSARNLISSALQGVERKPIPKGTTQPGRYEEQYQQNMLVDQMSSEEANSSQSKKVKIKELFEPVQITEAGLATPFGSYGMIPVETLVGSTTYLNQVTLTNEIQKLEQQAQNRTIEIQDEQGNTHEISIENVEKLTQRRCVGTNKNGKHCKKWTVIGFDTCPIHMSTSDKNIWKTQVQNLANPTE